MKYIQRYLAVSLALIFCWFFLGAMEIDAQDCLCQEEIPNCAVPLTSLNGQGYTLSGVTGGLTLDTSVDDVDAIEWLVGPIGSVSQDTAILVIDSFRTDPVTSDETFTIPSNLSALPDDDALEAAYIDGRLAHGALVFNHISALIQGALGSDLIARDADSVTWETSSGAEVVVQMVDALNYGSPATNTQDLKDRVSETIVALQGDGISRFILNMSFAVLPCNVANGYNEVSALDASVQFDEYIKDLDGAETLYFEQFITPLESQFNPDPLHYLIGQCGIILTPEGEISTSEEGSGTYELPLEFVPLEELYGTLPCERDSLHFVGSAGNSRLPYPFYPAAYPRVDSVSASEADMVTRSNYSNYNADMGLAGGWFHLFAFTDPPVDDVTMVELPIFYRGTSFSGPVRSVCLALNISSEPCESIPNP